MEDRKTNEFTARSRYRTAQVIGAIVASQPQIFDKVWNIYLDPETLRISLVVDEEVREEIVDQLKWVPDLDTFTFNEALAVSVVREHTGVNILGLPISDIQARYDLFEALGTGMPSVFPTGLRGIRVDAITNADAVITIEVDPRIEKQVVDMIRQTSKVVVVAAELPPEE